MASVVIDHTLKRVYHYCDYADRKTLSFTSILKSLSFQLLVSGDPPSHSLAAIRENLDEEEAFGENPHWIIELFLSSIHLKGSGTIVIDGMDEMSSGSRHSLIEILKKVLQSPTNDFKIFLTSQHREAGTLSRSGHYGEDIIWLSINQQCVAHDMERYIESEIDRLVQGGHLVVVNPELVVEVKQTLLAGACGMYGQILCVSVFVTNAYFTGSFGFIFNSMSSVTPIQTSKSRKVWRTCRGT